MLVQDTPAFLRVRREGTALSAKASLAAAVAGPRTQGRSGRCRRGAGRNQEGTAALGNMIQTHQWFIFQAGWKPESGELSPGPTPAFSPTSDPPGTWWLQAFPEENGSISALYVVSYRLCAGPHLSPSRDGRINSVRLEGCAGSRSSLLGSATLPG